MPSIKACLTHRHPYVRKNAVLAVFSIFRNFPELFPDAPDEIQKFLEQVSGAPPHPFPLRYPTHLQLCILCNLVVAAFLTRRLLCFLVQETDASTRRNAFVMVFQVAQDKAIAYIADNIDKVT